MRLITLLTTAVTATATATQVPFGVPVKGGVGGVGGDAIPRVWFDDNDSLGKVDPPEMEVFEIAVSGGLGERVNIAFFADGYTKDERHKFKSDVTDLAKSMESMANVSGLVNVYGVFVASNESGVGIDHPRDTPFGLYRSGSELRAVYPSDEGVKRARAACSALEECDHPALVGNDGLYGGLGGEFTIITASPKNGQIVLRHELGHSLIPVGEEYDGGFVYAGVNTEAVENVDKLKWREHLSSEAKARIEDSTVAVQAYPWHDLDEGGYNVSFIGSNKPFKEQQYVRSMLRVSLSSIPSPSHVVIALNGEMVDLAKAFPEDWEGSLDRRWLEIQMGAVPAGPNLLEVELSGIGRKAKAGQGGKMVTSVEVIEYAEDFNAEEGFVGAFRTFDIDGGVTLRPTNEGCLMRRVNHPSLCVVCAEGMIANLKDLIKRKK